MKDYLKQVMNSILLPEDAQAAFLAADEKIAGRKYEIQALLTKHFSGGCDAYKAEERLFEIAKEENMDPKTLCGLYLLYTAAPYHDRLISNGYSEQVYLDGISDFRAKFVTCKKNSGVWGIEITIAWYDPFYNFERFGLGRFQYENRYLPHMQKLGKDSNKIKVWGDMLNFHVPALGPLTKEERIKSYKMAYDFYADKRNGDVMTFFCTSWLLYPGNKEAMPSAKNVLSFIDDFKIVESYEDPDFADCKNVFGVPYNYTTEGLPQDTSMQREVKAWLDSGKKMGIGTGIFFYDGKEFYHF